MSGFVFYRSNTRPTGRALRLALGLHGGYGARRYDGERHLIRWGTSNSPHLDDQAEFVLNSAEAISRAANKWTTLNLLDEGLPQDLRFTKDHAEVWNSVANGDKWFGRKLYGAGGTDIVVIDEISVADDEVGMCQFYTKFVPNDLEFRFHVFQGEVIRYQKKCKRDESVPDSMVKNHANGYIFQTPERRPHTKRFEAAIKAVNILGLDFGAVDLIVPRNAPDTSIVLEVNTAPSCSPMTLDAYVTAIRTKELGIGD